MTCSAAGGKTPTALRTTLKMQKLCTSPLRGEPGLCLMSPPPPECTFIILDKRRWTDSGSEEAQCMIGDVNFFLSDPEDLSLAELEIMIAEPDYRGKGIGKEVTQMMMHYGVAKLGINKFQAKIGLDNEVSISMFKKLHFHQVSVCQVFKEVTLETTVDESLRRRLLRQVGHMTERDYLAARGGRRQAASQAATGAPA
ncbi:alpha/beta-tubulin-N-acetyltransferase 9-like isoform X4 [Festucalex cinctus]